MDVTLSRDVIYYCIAPHLSAISLASLSGVSTGLFHLLRDHPKLKQWKDYTSSKPLNGCLYEASKEGHRELVEFFIAKGATDWDEALCYASKGGHRDLVEFFEEKIKENS